MNTLITLQNGQEVDLANVVRYAYENLGELCLRMNDGSFITINNFDEICWVTYLLGEYKRQQKNDKQLVEKIRNKGIWF